MTAVSAVRSNQTFAAAGDASSNYTVQHGDSLSAIAQRFGVSLAALEAANPQISNPNRIYPGDRIHIPAGASDGGTQSPAPAPAQTGSAAPVSAGKAGPASGFSISDNGVKMIEGFEGYSATAYPDPGTGGAPWTIGYGHTKGVQPGQTITRAQAEQYLKEDLAWAQDAVRRNVHVPINQNQFDALVSLTYNLGANGYPGLLSKLNAGDYTGAQSMFGQYVHAGGHVLQGLVNRRAKEAALFGSDAPSGAPSAPPPSPPPSGGSHGGNYTVQPGDTLSAIASRQGVSLQALEAANPQIRDVNHIYPGQVIHLPGGSGSSSKPASGGNYTVRSGDTMSGIASSHGVSLSALLAANPQIGNPNRIYPGQVIHLPGGSGGGQAAKPASHDYTVRSGDTLGAIASRNGVSLAALQGANPQISNPNRIYPGQVIHIPGAGSTSGTQGTGGVQGPSGSSGASGSKVVDIAKQFLGRNASELKRSGALPMNPNVPSDVCCANFVSAVLQKAGVLNAHTDLVSGSSRDGRGAPGSIGRILKDHGWKVVDAAHAKPGDVCILNNGGHVELVASNKNGTIQLIGSNNTNADGTQKIGYGHPYGGAWYLTPG